MSLTDLYGRKIKYLRLSVTDLCNLRCIYCMPENGVCKKSHSEILSIEELTDIAEAAYNLGIKKIRLTGGEPLVRKGILTLCRNIRDIADDIELSLTTNGAMLSEMAKPLKDSGVNRLNISIDSFRAETYRVMTRVGNLSNALSGTEAAIQAGFDNIKINTVLMNGYNDCEIDDMIAFTKDNAVQLRFIELMPLGEAKKLCHSCYQSVSEIEQYLRENARMTVDGVARVYRLPSHKGSIGLISPMSHGFCPTCDKIRVTSDGKLKPCLHSKEEIDLRNLSGDQLKAAITAGVTQKPLHHHLASGGTDTSRGMNEIGG